MAAACSQQGRVVRGRTASVPRLRPPPFPFACEDSAPVSGVGADPLILVLAACDVLVAGSGTAPGQQPP